MARYTPTELITGFYADETMPWSQQDCVNWLPSVAEQTGTRTPVMAKTPPGLSPLVQLLENGASVGPVRGLYEAEGRLFTVMADQLYQVRNDLALLPLGTIPGTGKVRFAHNKIDGGNQVLAVNGSSGFVWNTADETFTKITDSGYPGAFDAVFIDGYLIQIEPGRRFAFHSDLSDALAYNTLDRFTSEVSPDALVAMAVANNELLLLSETTGEFFHNTGATQQPFRSKRISFDKGCAGRYAIATLGSTPFWLGNDGMFYAMNGYSPQRISTRPIEQAIRDLNWSQAIAFVWETEGHSVVYWTFPDGYTFGYDVGQPPGKQWHRRASYGLDRWRVAETAYWRNDWIASDFQYSRLYTIDQSYAPYEYQTPFVSELVGGCIHDNQNTVFMPYAEFLFDTGQPDVTVREFPPQNVVFPNQFFVYFLGGITTPISGIGYGQINPNSGEVTVLATEEFAGYKSLHEGGIGTNGADRVFVAGFTDDEVLEAYAVSGSALTLAGTYTGSGRFHGLAIDGNRAYTVQSDTDLKALMLDYDGAAWALTDSEVVNANPGSFNHGVLLHGAYVMVFADNTIGNRQIKAYSVAGDVFAEVGSLDVHLDEPAQPGMWSDGTYLYLDIEGTGDKVSVYTFNGTTFTEVTSMADPTGLTNGVMGGNERIVVRRLESFVMRLDVHGFDGATISAVTDTVQVPTYVAWAYDAGTNYLYAAGGPENVFSASLYDLSQSFTAVELGTNTTVLPIPDTGTPVQSMITVSNDLVECSGIVINVDITHPFIGDLLVTITEPGGQVYTLHEDDGAAGVDLVASIPAKFMSPVTVNGVWTLTITDTLAPDVGTLNNWQVTRIPAVLNNRFILPIPGMAVDETYEAGFIRGCPELS